MRGTGTDAWATFLARPDALRVWLVEIECFPLAPPEGNSGAMGESAFGEFALGELGSSIQAVSLSTLRVSSGGYTTSPTDTPASTHYAPRIENVRVDARVPGSLFSGAGETFAEIELNNGDGYFDGLLESYAIDGRTARILVGDATWPRAGSMPYFMPVFTGTVAKSEIQFERLRITCDSRLRVLDVPMQRNLYSAGEGGGTLNGRPRPLCFGLVRNVTPVLIDPVSLIYQVHDGDLYDIPAVYDRGVPLTRVFDSPGLGQYLANTTNGTFQLGGSADGEVTADVQGTFESEWPVVWFLALAQVTGELTLSNPDYEALHAILSGTGGWFVGPESATGLEVLNAMAESMGAFFFCDSAGALRLQHLGVAIAPTLTLSDRPDALQAERIPLNSSLEPAVYRTTVGYARNWTVQTDLADSVEAARISLVGTSEQIVTNEDAGTLSRHPLAKKLHVSSMLATSDGATVLAQLLNSIYGGARARLRLRLGARGLLLELGDSFTLQLTRFGLSGGASVRVVGWAFDTARADGIDVDVVTSDPQLLAYRDPGSLVLVIS